MLVYLPGFTQGDVGLALGNSFPNDFSQTTISRFEASNLSPQNMRKLKPLIERWLVDQESAPKLISATLCTTRISPEPDSKRRKKRTTIEENVREALEVLFQSNPKPSASGLTKIANEHNIERDVVRVWFCNRRQKEKKFPKYLPMQPVVVHSSNAYQQVTNAMHANANDMGLYHQPAQSNASIQTDNAQRPHLSKKARQHQSQVDEATSAAMMSIKGATLRGYTPPTKFHDSSVS